MLKNIFKKIISFKLQILSRLILWKYKPKIIVITGSVGKTSTKDAMYAVLSKFYYVRKSDKSYNSEIGLPLTIIGCNNGWNNPFVWFKNFLKAFWLFVWPHEYPKWLILEVGVGKPGDMKKTASWLKTDVVIMTAIGDTPVHIEFFNSRKHLIEEKSMLIKTLKKDGILILNSDDDAIINMKSKTKNIVFTYGFKEGSDILASSDVIHYSSSGKPEGIIYRIDQNGSSLPVVLEGVFGRNHIYASLASLAVSFGLNLNMINAVNALKSYDFPPGRMRILKGIKDTQIIDDTYNSSPFACETAINTLGQIKIKEESSVKRKIVVLGDMLELGKHTEEAHKNIGKMIKDNADILVVVGQRAQYIKIGAIESGIKDNGNNIFEFKDSVSAGVFLENFIEEGDLILVKGSQGMRMEKVVEKILEDKNNKEKLLVRQEKEWLAKN